MLKRYVFKCFLNIVTLGEQCVTPNTSKHVNDTICFLDYWSYWISEKMLITRPQIGYYIDNYYNVDMLIIGFAIVIFTWLLRIRQNVTASVQIFYDQYLIYQQVDSGRTELVSL